MTILFQDNHSTKMARAFKEILGFGDVELIPHRGRLPLKNGVSAYCYHSRQIDSALALSGSSKTLLNLNDCEMSAQDLSILKADLGKIDVILNQFSIAGFSGIEESLTEQAAGVLANYARDTQILDADYTVPFASFVYFCCSDNAFINNYANTPAKAVAAIDAVGRTSVVMRPGDRWEVGRPFDNGPSLMFYEEAYRKMAALPAHQPQAVPLEVIAEAFGRLSTHLRRNYSGLVLRALKPVVVEIPDLGRRMVFEIRTGRFEPAPETAATDLRVNSQPLHFAFANPFGVQTLGVSGRFRLLGNARNWMRHRTIFALNNAEIYLSARHLVKPKLLKYFWSRRKGIASQVAYRIRRMRKESSTNPASGVSAEP